MYIIYAFLGAIMASVATIAAKAGLKDVDSNLLTALRSIVMAVIVALAAITLGKLTSAGITSLTPKNWFFIVLSGMGGALSWLFFFHALSSGPTVAVTVIDKLSIVFTAVMAAVILAEGISLQATFGLIFIISGTLLVAIPWNTLISIFK